MRNNKKNNSQFPLWDFGECNYCEKLLPAGDEASSQFPLWDFGECNPNICQTTKQMPKFICSQFPLWDFGECNITPWYCKGKGPGANFSQFHLWDFGECNCGCMGAFTYVTLWLLSIPFVGFL